MVMISSVSARAACRTPAGASFGTGTISSELLTFWRTTASCSQASVPRRTRRTLVDPFTGPGRIESEVAQEETGQLLGQDRWAHALAPWPRFTEQHRFAEQASGGQQGDLEG